MRTRRDWGRIIRNVFTNWRQPMPLPTKLALTVRNGLRRFTRPGGRCCGHPGQPGC